MPELPFGTSAYARTRGNLPDLPVINMFAEEAPTEQGGVTLQSRLGLARVATIGSGPIRDVRQADGVIGGERFTVSGSQVFIGGTLLGTIDGNGPVSFAASPDEVLFNAGSGIWRTDGTTWQRVTFPDNAPVARIAFIAGYFIALRKGTQQWHFSGVLDGLSWDGLDFANAENEPDQLLDVVIVDDVMALIGSSSVEFWPKTGDAALPFAPTAGKVLNKGAIATGCACAFDNTFAYIGANGIVYMAANVPTRVSDAGIEERVNGSSTHALWTFSFEGHDFLAVRLSTGTFLRDAQSQQWCEFASWGRANWRIQNGAAGVFGDDETGTLWRFEGYADDDGVLERRFRAGLPITGGSISCDSIRLKTNPGQTKALAGQTFDPIVEMRSSRDRANTWTVWRSTKLGEQGQYRTRVEWRRNGRFDDPGGLFEIRCTDPVPFGASGVLMNEPGGGRSR